MHVWTLFERHVLVHVVTTDELLAVLLLLLLLLLFIFSSRLRRVALKNKSKQQYVQYKYNLRKPEREKEREKTQIVSGNRLCELNNTVKNCYGTQMQSHIRFVLQE